jgi:hypothetical protein
MGYPVIRRSWDQDNFIERKLKQNYEFKFLINSTLNDEIAKKYIQLKKKRMSIRTTCWIYSYQLKLTYQIPDPCHQT